MLSVPHREEPELPVSADGRRWAVNLAAMARPLFPQSQWSMIEGHGILVSGESVSRFVLRLMFSKCSNPSSGVEQAYFGAFCWASGLIRSYAVGLASPPEPKDTH